MFTRRYETKYTGENSSQTGPTLHDLPKCIFLSKISSVVPIPELSYGFSELLMNSRLSRKVNVSTLIFNLSEQLRQEQR